MTKLFMEILFYDRTGLEKTLEYKHTHIGVYRKLPKEVVVSPEDSVTVVKLQTTGYWRTINTCPKTQ